MITQRPVDELIQNRISCRSYTGASLAPDIREKLDHTLSTAGTGPFGTRLRFSLVSAEPDDSSVLKRLGTYGFIKGAAAFIIGAVGPSEYNLEDYGYAMEKIVLCATDLELGTCWLGGSFNKSRFAEEVNCSEEECVPAVAAIGLKADKRRIFDSTVRLIAGSARRKSFEEVFYDQNFDTPLVEDQCGPFARPLEMVRLAPSATNRQPWRIIRDRNPNVFHLFLARTRNYYENNSRLFGMMDIQRIDMGIAMCHFELACRQDGIDGRWTIGIPPTLTLPLRTSYVATWTA